MKEIIYTWGISILISTLVMLFLLFIGCLLTDWIGRTMKNGKVYKYYEMERHQDNFKFIWMLLTCIFCNFLSITIYLYLRP